MKVQPTTASTTLALLFVTYSTESQFCCGTACSHGLSITTTGTLGPAVIGTVPIRLPLGRCRTTCVLTTWLFGSKALSVDDCGMAACCCGVWLSLLTFSGVQTLPVFSSLNWVRPLAETPAPTVPGAWAKAEAAAKVRMPAMAVSVRECFMVITPHMSRKRRFSQVPTCASASSLEMP